MKNNLTEGNILKSLVKLALPIMGSSFIQMSYNLANMFWMGFLGSKGVSAIGMAGFYTWLAFAFISIPKVGAEVGVSQSVGRKSPKEIKSFIKNAVQMNVFFAISYGITMMIFRNELIGFFGIGDADIVTRATSYLLIISAGMVFYFLSPVFTAIFNGHGDSRTPFLINALGIVMNLLLDPVLILGLGPFPRMEVAGAAVATVISQFTVSFVFIIVILTKTDYFAGFSFLSKPNWNTIKKITAYGIPVSLQSGAFTFIAMIITRIMAKWGSIPITVQSIGSQIESLSWMTAGGFQTALGAFVGQNYGAKKWDRIYKGYFTAIGAVAVIGVFTSSLLIFLPKPIFSIFIREPKVLSEGIIYLRILGASQLFMCMEITTAGAFNGLGKTVPPSLVGIVMNGLRIPGALTLPLLLGLSGVWWSISLSSILKGLILTTWFIILLMKHPEIKEKRLFSILRLKQDLEV